MRTAKSIWILLDTSVGISASQVRIENVQGAENEPPSFGGQQDEPGANNMSAGAEERQTEVMSACSQPVENGETRGPT